MPADALLRVARHSRGLTQRALALRSRTAQSAIAALESGRHDPLVGTLERHLRAAGSRLAILPTLSRSVADAADEIRALLKRGRESTAFRQLIQVADDLGREHGALRTALTVAPPGLVGDSRFDAFLAALVEHRLAEEQLPTPTWTSQPRRYLHEPWFVVDLPEFVEDARKTSPPAFVEHGVYVNASELESV